MTLGDTQLIGIPELLTSLRADLDTARENLKSSGQESLLNISSAEIEVLVTISRSEEASGGLSVNILGLGLSASAKDAANEQHAHKLKLILKPESSREIGVAGPR